MPLSPKLIGFLDRVSAVGDKSTAMRQMSVWMTKNLWLDGRRFNFNRHEMQEGIASDQHPDKCIKKCAQIGMTELALRITASIAAVTRSRLIYVFPSAKFAEKVSADRFLPIIQESPVLAAMQHPEVKSVSMRKLGNSTIYFQGASGTTQAISIPASHLIIDEEDFCDPVVLSQFNARLRHAEEDPVTGLRGMKQRFSTPTIPHYGVSARYDSSDQKVYKVKCSGCNDWQAPSYFDDFVIPGYDGVIEAFDKTDLHNPKYKVSEAYVKCKGCGKDLWKDLMNPKRRQWVSTYPSRIMVSGYAISPIDVPYYNKVPAIFMQLQDYTIQDHRNFVLGVAHEDKHNSFLMTIFGNRTDAFLMTLEEATTTTLSGIRIGVDIGKVAHLIVGKRVDPASKDLHIIHMARLSIKQGTLAKQIQVYIDAFLPDITVLDAGPDFSTPQTLVDDNIYGQVFGCEYHRHVVGAYTNLDPRPEEGVVKASRSGTLSDVMKRHNAGQIHYLRSSAETDILKEHLKVTKKITRPSEMGDVISYPKPDKPDHFAHALNYLNIADTLASEHDILPTTVGVLPNVTGVVIGENAKKEEVVNFWGHKYS